ncbi:M56 family metallopeptidase [Gimesia aquarii]|uniref:Regulatory protein BlaR1 n=1 Tax=Gimesia aquarii TaxID=2527964 RepID=A0A517W3Y8_9PLAN|nr:M56 family metallopeptidase [Gimesia aquarii]QDT99972.1 Regulatory protein BlaR1 [Gimesia aquarii]
MFQISNQWMLFLLDISTKSLLLVVIAGTSLKLFKLRDSNVRHRVWSGVLAGMLLLPLLALVLPTIPLSIPAGWTNRESTIEQAPLEPTQVAINETSHIVSNENSPLENRDVSASLSVNLSGSMPQSTSQDEEVADTTATVSNGGTSPILWTIPSLLFILWIAVSLTFALRLFAGLYSSSQLLHRSVIVAGPRIQDCLAKLPTALLRRLPAIRESNEVLVPVTVGWLRPTVLLPEDWQTWAPEKFSAIVAHEFTHVARRDFFVTLAAELNRCLYWFHPVSWWLRSRLSDLAEEACDDAAIDHIGDRIRYARHLLEVATSLTSGCGQRVQPGVSMARGSNVESRIASILDFKRPLSQHLSWRSATAIALIAIPVITAAAAIRPASSAIATSDQEPIITAATSTAPTIDTETVRIHGQVTDTNAEPIPNAKVRLYRMQFPKWYAGSNPSTLLTEFKVDGKGRFDQTVAKDKVIRETKNHASWKRLPKSHMWWTLLVVSAPNYAYSTFGAEQSGHIIKGKKFISPGFLQQSLNVKLRSAVTIRGRLLSIEGQPVEGASVSVFRVNRPDASRLDSWIQQTSKVPLAKSDNRATMWGGPVSQGAYFPVPAAEFQLPQQCIQPVVTNRSGIFELSGLAAKNDLVILRIKDKRLTDTIIHVLARDMKTVYGHHSTKLSRTGAYYGRTFDFITQPSVPVYGVVRDIETKRPLAGIPVAVGRIYGTTMSHTGYITTTTDEKGRYRIEGLPIPPVGTRRYERNNLAVRPGKLPYIETDLLPVPRGDGVNPIELNIELRRAVMAKGRLTNKATGAPIALAEIYYAPYMKNENCEKYHRYSDGSVRLMGNSDTRYYSNKDGYFEIPVIPGRGVIAATIKSGEYITGFGADKIEAFQGKDPSELGVVLSDHLVPSLFHSLKEIDVPVDLSEFTLDMHVDEGVSMTMNFVDPGGDPVKGLIGNGLSSNMGGKMIKDDQAEVTGLAIGVIRPMYFSDNTKKLMRFIRLIPEKGQTHFTVKLFPPSRLKGRLVDPEGRPLANVALETRHQNDPFMGGSLPQTQTDKDGRFDYPLPTGTSYKILTKMDKYFIVMEELGNPKPKNIDLGDLILDPDAERWSNLKAKREPVISDLASDIVEDVPSDSNTKD